MYADARISGRARTKRDDVLAADHEHERRAGVAGICLRRKVGGGDNADDEAELVQCPACGKSVSTVVYGEKGMNEPIMMPQYVYFSGWSAAKA